MGVGSVSKMIKARKEPATILRINKETRSWTFVIFFGNWENFWWAITGCCLGRPNTNLPSKYWKKIDVKYSEQIELGPFQHPTNPVINIFWHFWIKYFFISSLCVWPVIEDQTLWTTILEYCVVILILIKFDTPVKSETFLN